MKHFRNLREWIWPLLEGDSNNSVNEISSQDVIAADENLKTILEVAIKDYQSEDDRAKLIDSKSSLFIGTISVITSVIIAVTTVLVKETNFDASVLVLVLLLFMLTLYMARTIWFSIKVLERRNYHTIDIDDYLTTETGNEYVKNLIVKIVNKTRTNASTINSKVDYMVMAQEYFKRAIVVVTSYSFVIFIFYLSKSDWGLNINGRQLADFFNNLSISGWNTLIIYVLIAASLLLSLKSLYKKRK